MGARGGARPGAGRPRGSGARLGGKEQQLTASAIAWYARDQRASGGKGPQLDVDNLQAAQQWLVYKLCLTMDASLIRRDYRSANEALERLLNRLLGKEKHEVTPGAAAPTGPQPVQKHVHEIRYVDSPDLPDGDDSPLGAPPAARRAAKAPRAPAEGTGAGDRRRPRPKVG